MQPLRVISGALEHLPPRGWGVVYLLCVPGWVYVGQTKRPLPKRWDEHLDDLAQRRHVNDALLAAYREHGAQALVGTVLDLCPLAELDAREIQWIVTMRRRGYRVANERG